MLQQKTVFIMVGLPARGKTFLASRLKRYLNWQGYKTETFNVGEYRRKIVADKTHNSDFFDPDKKSFAKEREEIAKVCFGDLMNWLKNEGEAAIYDATNVTSARRKYLAEICAQNSVDFIFIENSCNDLKMFDEMVKIKIKNSADYKNKEMFFAEKDFRERVTHYEKVYESIDRKWPYIKIVNFGEMVENNFPKQKVNNIFQDIAEFLRSINLVKKNIFLVRHGESLFNLQNRIGGDSHLSDMGKGYSAKMAEFFNGQDMIIFTSEKARAKETADFFNQPKNSIKELNEINSGICDSMIYEEIAFRYPEIDKSRKADKFNFRYPDGESYEDVVRRVRKVIMMIESQKKDVLIIGHRAVNRCLFSYFVPIKQNNMPYINMPLGEIIKISPVKDLFEYKILKLD